MRNIDCKPNEEFEDWARENKRWKFAPRPYPFKEAVIFLKNYVLGPSKKFKGTADFLPKKSVINKITPKLKLGFIGDLMKMADYRLVFDESITQFFKDIDFLIGNFEGIITKKFKRGAIGSQIVGVELLEYLKDFFPPERTILSLSNNHAGDFGWEEFQKTYETIQDHGFQVIGRRDEPTFLFNNEVNLAVVSYLSDQPVSYISNPVELDSYYNKNAKFNILYPHWGWELQLYPHPQQVKFAKDLIKKWDMLMGHHAHNPQPITAYPTENGKKVVAYCLGDFSYGLKWKKYHHYGLVVKVDIGPNSTNIWQAGQLDWQFTKLFFDSKEEVRVSVIDTYKHFRRIT
jgi:poly-gamma-glutamate capsule biosynthesis protein CapA/YwtB (metallophosphatase superfamily)